MQSIKQILSSFNPLKDKYISREYQAFGIRLAEKLKDTKKKSLYIKLAKTIPRPVIEQALRYVVDSRARNRAALFMWKLKQLNAFNNKLKIKKQISK